MRNDLLLVLEKSGASFNDYFQELLNSTSRVVEETVGRQGRMGEVCWMKIKPDDCLNDDHEK